MLGESMYFEDFFLDESTGKELETNDKKSKSLIWEISVSRGVMLRKENICLVNRFTYQSSILIA
jgi:hypothetical protein